VTIRRDPNEVARELASQLPRDIWIVAGTPIGDMYPCQCHVRPAHARGWKTWTCSPAFCPCAGHEPEGRPADCCAWRVGPAEVVMAKAAWDLKKRMEAEILD
jgi:hypothetical protein